jgi:hypothetical protein
MRGVEENRFKDRASCAGHVEEERVVDVIMLRWDLMLKEDAIRRCVGLGDGTDCEMRLDTGDKRVEEIVDRTIAAEVKMDIMVDFLVGLDFGWGV